jgi:antitoxin CcdA
MHMSNARSDKANPASGRRATNVSLSREHLAEARELGINISQACERGLVETLAEVRAAHWLDENREAIESWNAWVEKNGLPLASKRLF